MTRESQPLDRKRLARKQPHPSGAAALALLGLLACDGGAPPPPAPAGRVQAVAARAPETRDLDGFCDARPAGQEVLTLPAVVGDTPPAPTRPRWLSVWATWCKPCIEELPMIERWTKQWRAKGGEVDVVLMSVDADAASVETFQTSHPEVADTLRIADAEALPTWMTGAGFDTGAGLPLHVFTDAAGHPRCLRAGAVLDDHRPIVERLLGLDGEP